MGFELLRGAGGGAGGGAALQIKSTDYCCSRAYSLAYGASAYLPEACDVICQVQSSLVFCIFHGTWSTTAALNLDPAMTGAA